MMTGAVETPVEVTGTVDMSTGQTLSPAYVNSFRISAVTSRLLSHISGEPLSDSVEFSNLCLSLARGIDYAVSNNEVPDGALDLPYLLKQVCQRRNDLISQSAVMVLMISVKTACSKEWFSEMEKEELYVLSKEMQSNFCSVSVNDLNSNVKNKETNLHPTISTIMSRFYPGMKMGEIFSLVETMPGYDSYVTDLYISKSSRISPDDKIYLFVAQTDNVETSSCLVNPQQVSFLLNGEGVDKRTYLYKLPHRDPGPQMPTPVTHMLKYGSNLLQVVGQFNGRYIIVIGYMSVVSNPSFSTIPDYVAAVATQPDNEITEGPSRISIKCPISFSRIKIPVKGHSCKHLQCFDFDNYVEINSRRPLWRCPHCSQSVCFHDIRIDQSMVKVLKEVGEDVTYVKISGDGSWEAVTESISNEHTEKSNDATTPSNQDTTTQNVDDIMDLTENDDEMENIDKDDDKKPSPAGLSSVMNTNIAPHMEDGFWREVYSSTLGTKTTTTNSRLDVCDVTQRNDLVFNSLTWGHSQSQSQSQSQTPISNNIRSQRNENSNNSGNGHVRYPPSAAWATRTQNTNQALPAQNSARNVGGERQLNFSRSHLNRHIKSQHDHLLLPSQQQTPSQVGARAASPLQINGKRYISPLSTYRFNSNQHQSPNQRTQHPVRSSGQPFPHLRQGGVGTMTNLASSQSPRYPLPAIQRPTFQVMSQSPSVPPPIRTSGSPSGPVAAAAADQRGSSVDASAEENRRPTGRMRGSLSGWQYTEALKNQSIIQPSQPVQAARPPPALNTPRPFIPPHFQALMANNPRPQAGGSGPGPDSSTGGDPGSDK